MIDRLGPGTVLDTGRSPEVPMAPHEYQNPDLWGRELSAAGWKQTGPAIWRDPEGVHHLGPFGAWRKMRARELSRT